MKQPRLAGGAMLFPALIALAAPFCAGMHWHALDRDLRWQKSFWPWLVKGVSLPLCFWLVANLGVSSRFPPLVPELLDARAAGGKWVAEWLMYGFAGFVHIILGWAAVTYLWLLGRMSFMAQPRLEFAATIVITMIAVSPFAAVVIWIYGPTQTAAALILLLLPSVQAARPLADCLPPRPMYSRAISRLKFGKYKDAEQELISELEKKENDFEGWMLLAELYAKHYNNIEDAAQVILDICNDEASEPIQISLACHKLADWQLEAGHPDGARAALDFLCRKLPGSHFAFMAELRKKRLPRDEQEQREMRRGKPIQLPSLKESQAEGGSPEFEFPNAKGEAERLVAILSDDPNDIPAREKLARVLAEGLSKPALGIGQLELLLEIEDAEPDAKARWIAQVAAWEYTLNKNTERCRKLLEQLVAEYPQTVEAFAAQRRLFLLDMEAPEMRGTPQAKTSDIA